MKRFLLIVLVFVALSGTLSAAFLIFRVDLYFSGISRPLLFAAHSEQEVVNLVPSVFKYGAAKEDVASKLRYEGYEEKNRDWAVSRHFSEQEMMIENGEVLVYRKDAGRLYDTHIQMLFCEAGLYVLVWFDQKKRLVRAEGFFIVGDCL